FLKSGPRIELRPKLPKWNTFLPPTVATGRVKTAPVGQFADPTAERGSHTVFVNHRTPFETVVWTMAGLPVRSGRTVPLPVNVVLTAEPATTFNGLPDCSVTIVPKRQTDTIRLPAKGNS